MKDLTSGNIYKTFLLFAFPMVLAALLSQTYNTVDTIIAGRYLGEEGLAAIGATAPLITFVSSIFWGFNNGFAIYIARLYGAREYPRIKRAIATHMILFLVSCVLVGGLTVLFYRPLFDLFRVDPAIRESAFRYFAVYMSGLFFVMMNLYGLFLMNAFGSGTFPFLMSVVTAVLNVTGNIVSVVVLDLGVLGIALATVVAAAVTTVFYFLKLAACFREMGVAKEKVGLGTSELRQSAGYAVPNCIQQTAMYFASLALSPAVNGLGAAASATYTLVLKVYDINATVYQNSAKTLSNYAAQCVGAGKRDRIMRGVRAALVQGICFFLPFFLVCVLAPDAIASLFLSDKTGSAAEVVSMSVRFMRFYLPFIFLNVINNLFHSLFRGINRSELLLAGTVIGSVSRIVASYLLVSKMGMDGFFLGWVISWGFEAAFCAAVFFSGTWKPKAWRLPKREEQDRAL